MTAPPAPAAIRILVADDHPTTREGLALILDHEADMAVVAQARDGAEAVALFAEHRPDVAIVDLQMPKMGGVAATEAILRAQPGARVVLFTTYDGDDDVYRGLRAGAKAFLLKDSPTEELLRAIRAVHAGQGYVSHGAGVRLAERAMLPQLTPRELAVLRLVARGRANKEIGAVLGLSEGTVKSHLNAITSKLGATGRTDAALIATRRGLLRD